MDYTYKLDFITPIDNSYRSVAFLISENPKVTAKTEFDQLDNKKERAFRTRFDTWKDGHDKKSEWYHGWNQSQFSGKYTKCFVFEHKGYGDRFYGFLCNPKKSNPRYQLCVLVVYDRKEQHETKEINLITTENFRTTFAVRRIIEKYFGGL